jgi:hypothetical protein
MKQNVWVFELPAIEFIAENCEVAGARLRRAKGKRK